jgi:hypothetical protein
MVFLNQSYSEPSFEILRSCIDLKPKNSSIRLTELVDGAVAKVNENNCENQFDQEVNGHLYGMVTCNDEFYLIINDQKIKADTAINRSINPEIKPGWIFTNRARWYRIDQGDQSYLCIQAAITESGIGAKDSQYYMIENAFEKNAVPVMYYYFFDKNLIPITSEHF